MRVEPAAIERAAALIRVARLGRVPLDVLPADCRPSDEDEAYRVQEALNRQLTAAGEGPSGFSLADRRSTASTPSSRATVSSDLPAS